MRTGGFRRGARLRAVAGLVGTLFLTSCLQIQSTATYPVDFYYEMHYEPAVERGQPPRRSAPSEAVPRNPQDRRVRLEVVGQLQNPVVRNEATLARGKRVYEVNCLVCHGADGRGSGILAAYFRSQPSARPPADLTGTTQALSDGAIYAAITNGRYDEKTMIGMPPFGSLLRPEDRWAVVHYLRSLAGR